jgi:hypothetical protein
MKFTNHLPACSFNTMARPKSSKKANKEPKEPKKKAGRRGWTTSAQVEYLSPLIPKYLEHKTSKTLHDFWPRMFEKWFDLWPILDSSKKNGSPDQDEESGSDTTDEKANQNKKSEKKKSPLELKKLVSVNELISELYSHSRQQIKDWFNNHTRESYRGESKKDILDLAEPKKNRQLSLVQAYSHLYYDTRVKDIVAVEWPKERARIIERRANGEDVKEPEETAPVWFRNKMTKVEFLAETEEIQAEVEKYRQAGLNDEAARDDLDTEQAKAVALATARAK